MKIKAIGAIVGILVGIVVGPTLAVSTISLSPSATPGGPEYRLGGGELWVTVESGTLGMYRSGDKYATFCIELDEDLDFDAAALDAVINPAGAIDGGVGGTPDGICVHTAWLFDQFLKGTLPYYEFDGSVNGGADRLQSAITLQNVIWGLEDELRAEGVYYAMAKGNALHTFTDGALQQQFFDAADAAIAAENWTNENIRVLNVYVEGKYPTDNIEFYRQDLLIRIPAPGAIWLGVVGIGLVGGMRRRRAM